MHIDMQLTNADLLHIISKMEDNAPITESYRSYWQTSGGYIELAQSSGMKSKDITQRWHLLEAWAGGPNANSKFTVGNLRCWELLLYIGEMLELDFEGITAGAEAAQKEVEKRKSIGKGSWTAAAATSMKNAYFDRTGNNFIDDVKKSLASHLLHNANFADTYHFQSCSKYQGQCRTCHAREELSQSHSIKLPKQR